MSVTTTTTTGTGGHVCPEDFRHYAACRGADADVFFPVAEDGPLYEAQVAAAKAVCAGCPVRAECLTWALALPYGVAGGMTERERRQERARRRGPRGRCREPQRPVGGKAGEVAAAGRDAVRAGRDPRDVAREFGVTERTAARWAAQTRPTASTTGSSTAEGSAGCNRAPLLISHTATQAGTRAEGTRG